MVGALLGTVEQEQPPPSMDVSSGAAATHILVFASQSGAVAGQLVSSMQPTHIIVLGSQIGAVPGQSELFAHVVPQVCELPLQIGAPGLHSPLFVQPTQLFVIGSQTGVSPGHSELFEQAVPQVCVVVLQIGFGGAQLVLSKHCSHCLVTGSQMGVAVGQSAFVLHDAMQVLVVGSQTGVAAGQSLPLLHCTHLLSGTSHSAVVPTHALALVAVHWTQKSSGILHAGAALVQLASLVQPSVHWWRTVLQTPFGPVHWLLSLHWTHLLSGTSQTDVPAVHAVAFVAVHCVHVPAFAPAVTHAGAAAVAQAAVAPEPRSPLQPMHVPAALQMGVAPEHSALEPHCTQL